MAISNQRIQYSIPFFFSLQEFWKNLLSSIQTSKGTPFHIPAKRVCHNDNKLPGGLQKCPSFQTAWEETGSLTGASILQFYPVYHRASIWLISYSLKGIESFKFSIFFK